MIAAIVGAITAAFAQPSALSFGAAALWGLLSVFLSPCHLGAVPLIVAYINDGKRPERRSLAFRYSLLFAVGLLATLAAIGIVTSIAGRLLGDVGPVARIAVAVFLIACGLWLMDIPPFSKIGFAFTAKPGRRGALGALTLGLVYGVILGPCSFAFLAPMIAFVFSAGGEKVAYGAALMAFYAMGHTAAVVAAGTFGDFIGRSLGNRGAGAAAVWFKRALGALVVIAGIAQLFN